MKTKSQFIHTAFWVLLGIGILMSSLALNRQLPTAQDTTSTPTAQIDVISTDAETHEDVGSTDGIMILAVAIVLIIITPILLKRQIWSNGKHK